MVRRSRVAELYGNEIGNHLLDLIAVDQRTRDLQDAIDVVVARDDMNDGR